MYRRLLKVCLSLIFAAATLWGVSAHLEKSVAWEPMLQFDENHKVPNRVYVEDWKDWKAYQRPIILRACGPHSSRATDQGIIGQIGPFSYQHFRAKSIVLYEERY